MSRSSAQPWLWCVTEQERHVRPRLPARHSGCCPSHFRLVVILRHTSQALRMRARVWHTRMPTCACRAQWHAWGCCPCWQKPAIRERALSRSVLLKAQIVILRPWHHISRPRAARDNGQMGARQACTAAGSGLSEISERIPCVSKSPSAWGSAPVAPSPCLLRA